MNNPELKPCGHCGGNRIKYGSIRDGGSIGCMDCGAGLAKYHGPLSDTGDRLAAAWNTRAAPQVKPLVWEHIGDMLHRSPAPLFGSIRVESYGGAWFVLWSIPGYCDTLVPGDFDTPNQAKDAAQADYTRRILDALE